MAHTSSRQFAFLSFITSIVLVLASGCGGNVSAAERSHSYDTVALHVSPVVLNFGKVPAGSAKSMRLALTNTSRHESIEVSSATAEGAGYEIVGARFPLKIWRNSTEILNIKFAPSNNTGSAGTVTIASSADNKISSVNLAGNTSDTLGVSTSKIRFGSVLVGQSKSQSFTLSNLSTSKTVTVASVKAYGAAFAVSGASFPLTLTPGSNQPLTVTFAPTTGGSLQSYVAIASDASNSSEQIRVWGSGQSNSTTLGMNSNALSFGSVNVGSTKMQQVTLTNTSSSGSLTLNSATVVGTDFQVSGISFPQTLSPGQSQVMSVVYAPKVSETDSGSVTVNSTASNSAASIALSGTGMSTTATLGVSPTALDFGSVATGSSKKLAVTLTNSSSSKAISVSGASVSGTGFSLSGVTFPQTIAPSGSLTVSVGYAPTASGSNSGTLTIASDATNASASVALSGTGQSTPATLTVSPSSLSFGSVNVGSSKTLALTLTNASTSTAINLNNASVNGTGFTLGSTSFPRSLAAGASLTLNVTYAPTASGAGSGTVSIASDATNATTTVAVSGTGQLPAATLSVNPTSLSFGAVNTGSSKTMQVTLSNPSTTTPITLNSATASGSGFSLGSTSFPRTLAAGGSVTLSVTYAPTATGTNSGSVAISSDATNGSASVALSGSGQTASATLSVSPGSLSFGTVTVGQSKQMTVQLSNASSSTAITISGATVGGNEYAISGASFPYTLAAGGSKTLTVTFTPGASGAADDTLTLSSNATNATAAVTLSGSGQAQISHYVDVSWTPSTSNVVGYNVYRGTNSGGPYSMINGSIEPSSVYTDNNVTAGQTYYYVITAVDSNNVESDMSTEAITTVPMQ